MLNFIKKYLYVPLIIAAYFSWGMSIQPHRRGRPVVVPNSPPVYGTVTGFVRQAGQ